MGVSVQPVVTTHQGRTGNIMLSMKTILLVGMLVSSIISMDHGYGGVYDSPMLADYYAKQQFGLKFGGGRSGVVGLRTLQGRNTRRYQSHRYQTREKSIVELSPLYMQDKITKQNKQFSRFMA